MSVSEQQWMAYVDGELDATEGLLIEEHLTACAPCAKRVHGEKAFRDRCRVRIDDSSGCEFVAGAQDHGLLDHINAQPLGLIAVG